MARPAIIPPASPAKKPRGRPKAAVGTASKTAGSKAHRAAVEAETAPATSITQASRRQRSQRSARTAAAAANLRTKHRATDDEDNEDDEDEDETDDEIDVLGTRSASRGVGAGLKTGRSKASSGVARQTVVESGSDYNNNTTNKNNNNSNYNYNNHDDNNDDDGDDDELAGVQVSTQEKKKKNQANTQDMERSKEKPKKRPGRPRKDVTKLDAQAKPRGRPRAAAAATVTKSTKEKIKPTPADGDESQSDTAPPHKLVVRTGSVAARSKGPAAAPAQKKKVTFQGVPDSDEELANGSLDKSRSQKGLMAKPARKPAISSGRGRRIISESKEISQPLSPKKAKQVARSISSYASSDGEDDELSSGKTLAKLHLVTKSPRSRQDAENFTGLSSPVKRINFASSQTTKGSDEIIDPAAIQPFKQLDFGESLFMMSSPAKRPPASPFQYTIKESARRWPVQPDDQPSSNGPPSRNPTPISPLKQSPRKGHLGASFSQSPIKSSLSSSSSSSSSFPVFSKNLLLASPAKRVPSSSLRNFLGSPPKPSPSILRHVDAKIDVAEEVSSSSPDRDSQEPQPEPKSSEFASFRDGESAQHNHAAVEDKPNFVGHHDIVHETPRSGSVRSTEPAGLELGVDEDGDGLVLPMARLRASADFKMNSSAHVEDDDNDDDELFQHSGQLPRSSVSPPDQPEMIQLMRSDPPNGGSKDGEDSIAIHQNPARLEDMFVESAPRDISEDESDVEDGEHLEESSDKNEAPLESLASNQDIGEEFDDDVSFYDDEPTLVAVDPNEVYMRTPRAALSYRHQERISTLSPMRHPLNLVSAQQPHSEEGVSPVPEREVIAEEESQPGLEEIESLSQSCKSINSEESHVEPSKTPDKADTAAELPHPVVGMDQTTQSTRLAAEQVWEWDVDGTGESQPTESRRRHCGAHSLAGDFRSSLGPSRRSAKGRTSHVSDDSSLEDPVSHLANLSLCQADLVEQGLGELDSANSEERRLSLMICDEFSVSGQVHKPSEPEAYAQIELGDAENSVSNQIYCDDEPEEAVSPPRNVGERNTTPASPMPEDRADDDDKENQYTQQVLAPVTPLQSRAATQLQTFHTVSKVPLRPEGEVSPLKVSRKRPRSLSGTLPIRSSPRLRRKLDLPSDPSDPSEPLVSAISPHQSTNAIASSPALEAGEAEVENGGDVMSPFLIVQAAKQTHPAMSASPNSPADPSFQGHSRENRLFLRGAVVYVDVHTTEGEDASGIFVELLQQMGARCVKSWSWNPRASSIAPSTDGIDTKDCKVGITHVIYKDGGVRTIEKVRQAAGLVKCVGVGWVLDCERENRWLDEGHYTVDSSIVPRGGAKRRKSMEPRALSNVNGTLIPLATGFSSGSGSGSGSGSDRLSSVSSSGRRAAADWGNYRRQSIFSPSHAVRTPIERTEKQTGMVQSSSYEQTRDCNGDVNNGNSGSTCSSIGDSTASPTSTFRVPETPGSLSRFGFDDIGSMTPVTPFDFSQRSRLVQQTCPPKQTRQGLFSSSPDPQAKPVADSAFLLKLEAARRKSLAFKPKVGSPLASRR